MRSYILKRKSHQFNLNALSVNHLSIGFWLEPDQSRMVSVHQCCLTPCIMKHFRTSSQNMKSDLNLSPLQQVMQLSVHFLERNLWGECESVGFSSCLVTSLSLLVCRAGSNLHLYLLQLAFHCISEFVSALMLFSHPLQV